MITLFLSPSCTSCRKARSWLTNHEVAFQEHNIITSPLSADELRAVLALTENATEDIISTRSKVFQKLEKNNLAFQLIVDRINRSVHGQFADIRNAPLKEEEYIAVIKQKSGALCALACLCGAMLAGNTTDLHLIGEYATGIGICAQLENDLDDVLHLGEKNDLIHKKWSHLFQ